MWEVPLKRILLLLMLTALAGCTAIGPGTIVRDRFDYSTNISRSWQKQMLLNIVKLRYADTPVFMDVTSVINQYSLESSVDLRANFQPGTDSTAIGGSGKYYDRPTITYMPMIGEKFTRSMMTPIPPGTIMALVQAGWPIDFVFWLNVKSINGLKNRSSAQIFSHPSDAEFVKLLKALRTVQNSGAIGLRVQKHAEGHETLLIIDHDVREDIATERDTIKELLGFPAGVNELSLVFGLHPQSNRELAMLTRSMFEIMAEMAYGVDISKNDIAERRATPAPVFDDSKAGLPALIKVMSGKTQPGDAFVAVPYRDQWFWIDDRDLASKRMLTFLMILLSLAETGGASNAPIVTIPAG